MPAPLILLAAAGGALKAYGTYTAAQSQAEAMRLQGSLELQKAEELIKRDEINRDLLFKSAKKNLGTQSTQVAASGRAQDVTTLAMMEDTANMAADQAIRNSRATQWEASAIKIGAHAKIAGADDIAKAGLISALGSLAGTAASTAYNTPGAEGISNPGIVTSSVSSNTGGQSQGVASALGMNF